MVPEHEPTVDPRVAFFANAKIQMSAPAITHPLIAEMRERLSMLKRVGCYFMFDSASYVHVIGNDELVSIMTDVETRVGLMRTGRLSSLLGMDVLTDAYMQPDQKLLPAHHLYVMAGDGLDGVVCHITHSCRTSK